MWIDTLHLLLDGYDCNPKKLTDFEVVYNFLSETPKNMGMTKMIEPYVVRWKDKNGVVPGLTGFVTIAESHLAVHTFPDEKRVYADIFSCRPFDFKFAVNYFKNVFEPEKLETKIVRLNEGIIKTNNYGGNGTK